jgi:hydrogenase large subunit
VDIGYVKATGSSVKINLPKTALKPAAELEWKIPQWSNAI